MDGLARHAPVMATEVVGLLAPVAGCCIVDCTLGLGGHAELLMQQAGQDALLIGLDVDERNLVSAKTRFERFGQNVRLFQANFARIGEVLAHAGREFADIVLADLGVCSAQLDDPARGLSFQADGPLDMRLDNRIEKTAADLVNGLDEERLADIIFQFAQERYSRRIARAISAARKRGPILRTGELARIVAAAYPRQAHESRRGVHPATRTFQALRMAVNDEPENLRQLLESLPRVLAVGGRAAIISFHSLEDGPVKRAFAAWAASGGAKLLNKKPLTASAGEVAQNPRSRSAKLRGIQRIL
ncbi:MAG: 16S rRNA (cytosine(1402)-N(4))-methyltransferase RsmH [Planctomycetes bacterium]|nr:16S rRNA (cytosine(1402)-N(4))-methyltransferase RsmH [Planctomycetota bacterium]